MQAVTAVRSTRRRCEADGVYGGQRRAAMNVRFWDRAMSGVAAEVGRQADLRRQVGHVGDGNFHTVILVPPEPDGLQRAWDLDKKIVARALSLGGSCSGEHGVGIGKREFLEQEHGAEALAVMRSVKQPNTSDQVTTLRRVSSARTRSKIDHKVSRCLPPIRVLRPRRATSR